MRLFGLGPSHQEARKPKEAALFANKIQCAGCIVQSGNGQLGKQAQFQHDSPDFGPLPVLSSGLCQPVKGGAGLRQMLQMIQTKRRTASHVL